MTVPNIDTFEQDVSEEIKKKEASLTDIASASGTVQNTPPLQKKGSLLVPLLFGVLFIVLLGGAGGYYYLSSTSPAPVQPSTEDTEEEKSTPGVEAISNTLFNTIGPSIASVQKTEYGYILTLREYTPVFAYMIRNEHMYAEEIALAVGSPRNTSTSSPPFAFRDVTRSNQNMRVGTSASSTVVYAFVNSTHLLLSSSTEGILTLRGAILK